MSAIREAVPGDLVAVRSIARAAYAPYVARLGFEPPPMVEPFEGVLNRLLVSGEPPVGYVLYETRAADVLLENVAVHPDAAGRGIGRALIAAVEAIARDAGKPVVLYTNALMHENRRLYPALGYRETERRTEQGLDRIHYRKYP